MIISLLGSDSCYINENMTHSWFVNFDKDFNFDLPLWFIRWWTQFGSTTEIFPGPLMGSFKYFTSMFKFDAYGAKFPALLYFIKRYKVPWILKWKYDKESDVLAAGMLSGGISFSTHKQLLTMLLDISQPQILYLRSRSIPQCKKLNWLMHLLQHLLKLLKPLLSLRRRVLL
ncbi:hypothetical protein ACB092_08G086800 [Castanea dentata]